ncbi:ferroxidase fet3 [Coemansia guatemalensis]|uniref:Ferroxidase fet3 n=1 Tax=Coemansia guatemalensis TaxID=2761395 RepID=A0A9W8HZP6_9FUNG|nr:ferroxidase fet3 [Coemansia guatemalensis]
MLSCRLLLLVQAVISVYICHAARVVIDWDIGYIQVNRDGYNNRRAIGVNGALPIPPVYVDHGDTLIINVHNSLTVPTSIHAHGIFHNGTNYYDGAGMVTQCGIPPGESYSYTIEARQVGTYWIHGHTRHQNSDGLRAPFIIREKLRQPVVDYDDEYLLYLEDWYPTESSEKMKEITEPGDGTVPPPTYPFGLINGYNGNNTKPIRFSPGKRYRIRMVSMATTEWFKVQFPGHQVEVIEADGINCVPQQVDGFDMGPGQRYSAIVTALDTVTYNMPFNVTLYADFVPRINGLNPRYYQGLIEYREGAPAKRLPVTDDNQLKWANDIEMQPYDRQPALPVDRQIELTSVGIITVDKRSLRKLNKYPYTEPAVPSLFTAMTTGELAMDRNIYGPQAEALILRHEEVVEIKLNNPSGLVHSFHLHGHAFQVVEYGPVDRDIIEIPAGLNASIADVPVAPVRQFHNAPMRRDTLVTPVFEYVKIRFRADNPGVWMFHCHMDTHFAAGLAVTFIEAPDVLQQTQILPEDLQQMCLRQGIKASGNAAGNPGYDFTGLPPVPQELKVDDNSTFGNTAASSTN